MEHRLRRPISPEAYDIRIAPDLDAHTFTGTTPMQQRAAGELPGVLGTP